MFRLCKKCGQPTPSKTRLLCDNCISPGSKASKLANTGKPLSEATKMKLRKPKPSLQGKATWNKGKTSKPIKEPRLNRNHSEETKAKISRANKGKTRPDLKGKPVNPRGSKMSDLAKLKMSIAGKGKPKAASTKTKMAISAAKNVKAGKIGFGRTKKQYLYITEHTQVLLRNSWEYKVAEYLDKLGWIWIYEQAWITYNGQTYLPDFFIYDANGELIKIIEVKGYFSEAGKTKFNMFKVYLESCEIIVELWNEKKLKELGLL